MHRQHLRFWMIALPCFRLQELYVIHASQQQPIDRTLLMWGRLTCTSLAVRVWPWQKNYKDVDLKLAETVNVTCSGVTHTVLLAITFSTAGSVENPGSVWLQPTGDARRKK